MLIGAHTLIYSADAARLRLPDGGELGLYEPRHPTALGLAATGR